MPPHWSYDVRMHGVFAVEVRGSRRGWQGQHFDDTLTIRWVQWWPGPRLALLRSPNTHVGEGDVGGTALCARCPLDGPRSGSGHRGGRHLPLRAVRGGQDRAATRLALGSRPGGISSLGCCGRSRPASRSSRPPGGVERRGARAARWPCTWSGLLRSRHRTRRRAGEGEPTSRPSRSPPEEHDTHMGCPLIGRIERIAA